jgi:hypothetical protein
MTLHQNLATIRPVDVERLTAASEALAQVAETIKSTKANYVPAAVHLLIEVNNTVLAMRDRGLRRIVMYLQKHGGTVPTAFERGIPALEPPPEEAPQPAAWPDLEHDE